MLIITFTKEMELNDFIAYDWESIYAAIGLDTDEEEEDED